MALTLAGGLIPASLEGADAAFTGQLGALGTAVACGYRLGRRQRGLEPILHALQARNAALEHAYQQAEARIGIKTQFLAQISHELRTPMGGIIGFVELLAKSPLAEDQREKLRLIERSAKRLMTTINDVLELAKIEATQPTPKAETFSLRPCLEDTVGLLTPQAQVPIVLWVAAEVAPMLTGDPIRLQQVLTNLLGNAIKFTRAGRIVLRVRHFSGKLLFSVSDTGPGIPHEHLDSLFAPFVQLAAAAPNGERGTGLGLDIARAIVDSLGGRIGVVSKPGKGSTFWFTLPVDDNPPPTVKPLSESLALVASDPLSLASLGQQLTSLGLEVHGFASLADFLARYHPRHHGTKVIFNLSGQEQPLDLPARCIEHSKTLGAYPMVILPHSNQRIREYAREPDLTYLWHPVRSELFVKLLNTAMPTLPAPALGEHALLIIDDSEINRALLKAQLTQWGAQVVEAATGAEALAHLRTQTFDLVFLDLQLPDIYGADVLRQLLLGTLSPNHDTPFIAMSAHIESEQDIALVQAGFREFLLKPLLEAQLLQLVTRYLPTPQPIAAPITPTEPLETYIATLLARSAGSHAMASTLARKLVQEVQALAREIGSELLIGDYAAARRAVHKLNGSAAFCGLEGIREAAAVLEQGLLDALPQDRISHKARQLDREIEKFLALRDPLLAALSRTRPARLEATT